MSVKVCNKGENFKQISLKDQKSKTARCDSCKYKTYGQNRTVDFEVKNCIFNAWNKFAITLHCSKHQLFAQPHTETLYKIIENVFLRTNTIGYYSAEAEV